MRSIWLRRAAGAAGPPFAGPSAGGPGALGRDDTVGLDHAAGRVDGLTVFAHTGLEGVSRTLL
jgi:hypothetical protein